MFFQFLSTTHYFKLLCILNKMSRRQVNFKLDESGEYINFSSSGNNILADGILAKAAAIRRR